MLVFCQAQGNLINSGQLHIDAGTEVLFKGNLINNRPISGTGYLTYNGASVSHARGDSLHAGSFRMNASGILILDTSLHIFANVDFVQGNLIQQTNNITIHQINAFSGGNSNSYIESQNGGWVILPIDNQSILIPLGHNGHYLPVTLQQAGMTDTFAIKLWPHLTTNGLSSGPPLLSHVGLFGIELIDNPIIPNMITMGISWPDASLSGNFEEMYSTLIHYDTSGYKNLLPCPTDLSVTNPNTLMITGIAQTGLFGVGDSVFLQLVPQPTIFLSGAPAFCQGDSILLYSTDTSYVHSWNTGANSTSIFVSQSGLYELTLTDSNGCSSTSWPQSIQMLSHSFDTIYENQCDSFYWNINAQTYQFSGVYSHTIANHLGCDSTISLQLTIDTTWHGSQSISICPGDSIIIGNNTYYTPGTYTEILQSVSGCDSIVSIVLSLANCVSVAANNEVIWNVFPNPSEGMISIQTNLHNPTGNIEILNLTGQVITRVQLNSSLMFIDISHLPAGTYIIKISETHIPLIKL
ncbi:MAG: T9SS type A sorting domain-containing protein [Candidatus Competibacteraceae bacterium]|nr:T9SS type A sorting domain-containing protein [Candidatus Competibacteraceae bacterium]